MEALEKVGNAMDYLLDKRDVKRLWSKSLPGRTVDDGDRLAFVLLRDIFAGLITPHHYTRREWK